MSRFSRDMETPTNHKTDGGPLDEFAALCLENSDAAVSVTMGYAFAFGAGKCSVTVTLKCAQNEATIDRATRLATAKADELAQEGMIVVSAQLESENKA